MENNDNKSPETGANANLEQGQAAPQPTGEYKQPEAGQQPTGEQKQPEAGQQQQPETGQSQRPETSQSSEQPGYSGQSEALTEQKSNVEGSKDSSPPNGQARQPGFVGSEGASDTSSELIEDEDSAKDGQRAPEGQ